MKIVFFSMTILFSINSYAGSFVPSSFSAQYEESVQSVTGKTKKSFGKLDYKFPGHLRFEVTSPTPSLFVVNPQKTWLYQPAFVKGEMDQVTIQKSSNLPLIKFLDSIKDGVDNSKIFKAKFDKNDLILTFEKSTQKEMGFEEVILHSSKNAKEIKELKEFEQITLKYTNKNKTSIKLLDVKENVSFPAGNFEFTPAENTKVITN